jgi:hypothetical protein
MELETLKVCIDGTDCSGKTTLWNNIHKISGYRWKLEDRSFVTMVAYARLHGRPKSEDYYRQLIADLSNLNHKYICIHLPWEVIAARFAERGDHLHDFEAMKRIHAEYSRIIEDIAHFPNVLLFRDEIPELEMAQIAHEWILSQDRVTTDELISLIERRCAASPCGEVAPLRFHLLEEGDFPEADDKILDVNYVTERFPAIKPATVVEFNEMVDTFTRTLRDEIEGINIYNRPEGPGSRRFVFTQQACVSFIQVMLRDNMLKFYVTCRSSHVRNVFPADFRLLYHMAKIASKKLQHFGLTNETRVLFDFTLNSAHTVA